MALGALSRAARHHAQRSLLAWRQALAELEPPQAQLVAADQGLQQQDVALSSPPGVGMLHAGSSRGASSLAAPAASQTSLFYDPFRSVGKLAGSGWPSLSLPVSWQQQQARQFSLRSGRRRFQKREQLPDRNLPARNEQIRAREVRVIFPAEEDKPPEVMATKQALELARRLELDLVMVSPKAEPPVARLIEWSKVLYEAQKREKAAVKARLAQAKAAAVKEVRVGCQIAEHDLAVKMGQARRFLEEGHSLKLVVQFKGGQQIELGRQVTLYLIGQLADLCRVKEEKHLQRPMKGHWAVTLVPAAPPPAAVKQPGERKLQGAAEPQQELLESSQQQQQQQSEEEAKGGTSEPPGQQVAAQL